jgi:hypothetical protein
MCHKTQNILRRMITNKLNTKSRSQIGMEDMGCLKEDESYLHYRPTIDFPGCVLEEEKK